jgi:parallel beta-helix repeat protein
MLAVVLPVNVFSFKVLGEVGSGVHNLDSGLSYASIQEAIRANETLDGHTIFVDAGVYHENVVVDKSVSLVAEKGFSVVIDGGGNGTIVSVLANNVNITGFVIRYSLMEPDYSGIFLNRSSGCAIRNNVVTSCYYGARLHLAHRNTLLNNTFSNCSYGIWLADSERNVLSDNWAFNNTHVGLHIGPASHNILSKNMVWKNENGIYIYGSVNNTVAENRVFSNAFGIWLGACVNNVVYCNEVYNNTYGVRLAMSSTNTVLENEFEGNVFGIWLQGAKDNFIVHNNFLNNTGELAADSVNLLDNGMEGNYWSDYGGFDKNKDGIGDTPYVIDANNTDRYPLMGRFFGFPAVLEAEEYEVAVISNCSISDFEYSVEVQTLKFRVLGLNGTVCFCRVMFPRPVLTGPYMVVVDGVEVDAALLPVSNVSHAFLYFVFNMSDHEVAIGSKPFYTLLEKYNTLMSAYNDLIANYTGLWGDYRSLNASYNDLLGNYTNLQGNLGSLQAAYNLLNSSYNNLVTTYEGVKAELGDVRLLMYGFLAATVVGVFVSLVSLGFGFRYYRRFNEQRRIVEAYGLSPLDVASALFELDVKKRREKIEMFEEKYGVKIRPRASLEDIVKSLKSRKERRERG